MRERRSHYDVTNTVCIADPHAVSGVVCGIFERLWPRADLTPVRAAFDTFTRLYAGILPGYHGCDTWYHDVQHSLDCTLALARLIDGHERSVPRRSRVGERRARLGVICALFHDSGYIRRYDESQFHNGAEFTFYHVTRSSNFLIDFLPRIGFAREARLASRLVHFTGYEVALSKINVRNPLDRRLGFMLGTADLIAQMADRCYLEKCRDRLYPEFVVGEVAVNLEATGSHALYQTGQDLLSKTIDFYQQSALKRLHGVFNHAYRFMEVFFGNGRNLYLTFINRNLAFLETIRKDGDWNALKRRPPCALPDPNGEARLMTLAMRRLREISDLERENSRRLKVLDPGWLPPTRP
jgi:hypothetical protein